MIKAADANLETAGKDTIIIPGHGPIGNRAQLQSFRDMLVGCRDAVAPLKRKGMTLAETVAARPTAPFDDLWGRFVIDPVFFTKLVYQGA
ncbi:MAG: hypothetical protein WDN25_10325 [Acetobacteraceae bacterium]